MSEPSRREPEHSPYAQDDEGSYGRVLRHGAAVGLLGATAAGIVLLDQATKEWATKALAEDGPVRLLGGAVYLSLTRNSGAAFSLLRDYTFIFPVITLVVLGWIVFMARRLRSVPWAVSLGLILGGAFGNLLDRIFRAPGAFQGHVVDFLSMFDPHGQVWPIFNVADMSLVAGVLLAVGLEMRGRHRDGSLIPRQERTARGGRRKDAQDAGDAQARADQPVSR